MKSPQQTEQIRIGLLRHIEENPARFGLATAVLRSFLAAEGLELSQQETATELQYLADKGFVTTTEKAISPELRCWRITADGRDYLAMHQSQ